MVRQVKKTNVNGKSVMNIRELADFLGVHTSTVYKHAQNGSIPAFKIGSDWRFSRKHINSWMDEKMGKNKSVKL